MVDCNNEGIVIEVDPACLSYDGNPENFFAENDEDKQILNTDTYQIKYTGKKRTRNPDLWKKNQRKQSRLHGLEYPSSNKNSQTMIRKRELKPACRADCRICERRFTEEERNHLFQQFWTQFSSWQQRSQYISSCIQVKNVKCRRPVNNTRGARKSSCKYKLTVDSIDHRVCQLMFRNTFDITTKMISGILKRTTNEGIVMEDQRGRHNPPNKLGAEKLQGIVDHIKSFSRQMPLPEINLAKMYKCYIAKVGPTEAASEWYYRKIFKEIFNVGFIRKGNV